VMGDVIEEVLSGRYFSPRSPSARVTIEIPYLKCKER
jgi:hypothetical protein